MEYWETTQAALQAKEDPLVRKPKLTDALLQRPPFRFLHDVISAVQAKTGFAQGLFTPQEANAKTITDKDSKVQYLNKIIQAVEAATDQTVAARPIKIVAGLEPENTNIFLQLLAKASQQGDGRDAVAEVPGVEKTPGVVRGEVGRPASRPSSQRLSRQTSSASETGKPPAGGEIPARKTEPIIYGEDQNASKSDQHGQAKVLETPPPIPRPSKEEIPVPGVSEGPADASPGNADSSKPPLQRRAFRPQSAKRAPPKIKSGEVASRRPPSGSRPGTSSSGGSVQSGSKPRVFVEGEHVEEDVVDVVEETRDEFEVGERRLRGLGEDGALVKDILEVDQELVAEGEVGGDNENRVPDQGIVLQRRVRHANGVGKSGNLAQLGDVVQKFCQNVTPLGRCLEFLQEDVEAMAKEAKYWENEKLLYQEKVERALGASGGDLQELECQIKQVESQIDQVKSRILAGKGQVLINHQSIMNILMGASSRGSK